MKKIIFIIGILINFNLYAQPLDVLPDQPWYSASDIYQEESGLKFTIKANKKQFRSNESIIITGIWENISKENIKNYPTKTNIEKVEISFRNKLLRKIVIEDPTINVMLGTSSVDYIKPNEIRKDEINISDYLMLKPGGYNIIINGEQVSVKIN